ncbi:uncharacterized protein LOC117830552 isoform X3 [Notolabrus celidotus]|uniref:uncharacterized protein LOC117830552 isoform X3 n=1 Tax=Notolabrus celidotus TaxID=1203425 RepID=UPI001490088F|nr:uncharacterized protein LOC117830552 isoform X3 [Notolabrus celidotus]
MEGYLRARDTWWFHYFAEGLYWPRSNFIEDPPPPPAEEEEEIDVVGLDDEEEPRRPDGGVEEEIDVVGLGDEEELQVAGPRGDDGGADAPDRDFCS